MIWPANNSDKPAGSRKRMTSLTDIRNTETNSRNKATNKPADRPVSEDPDVWPHPHT